MKRSKSTALICPDILNLSPEFWTDLPSPLGQRGSVISVTSRKINQLRNCGFLLLDWLNIC